jgi:hypothetical protein
MLAGGQLFFFWPINMKFPIKNMCFLLAICLVGTHTVYVRTWYLSLPHYNKTRFCLQCTPRRSLKFEHISVFHAMHNKTVTYDMQGTVGTRQSILSKFSLNKAFVYISVFKILNFIRQLFIFSCFYSITKGSRYNNQILQEHKMK